MQVDSGTDISSEKRSFDWTTVGGGFLSVDSEFGLKNEARGLPKKQNPELTAGHQGQFGLDRWA